LKETPGDFLTSFEMFNSTYKLYTHRWGAKRLLSPLGKISLSAAPELTANGHVILLLAVGTMTFYWFSYLLETSVEVEHDISW